MTGLANRTDRVAEARLLAQEGYGWHDIVVRLGLSETTAKQIVVESEYRRLSQAQEAKP